jgi:ketosteroid isomerase-like protein
LLQTLGGLMGLDRIGIYLQVKTMVKALLFVAFSVSLLGVLWPLPAMVRSQESQPVAVGLAKELHGILASQQMAWNRGEIPSFMEAYWKDPGLTFSSGGKTTRGWQATLDRYQAKYPDRAAMGKLTFDALETQQLDAHSALTIGNWSLERDKPARGNFSLVWKKIDGTWRIVHDHSSLLAQ